MSNILTSVMLDTRRALKDGTYPVKLRLTFNRDRKYFLTPYALTEEDFAKTQIPKPRGEYKELDIAFQAIEQKARKIIEKIPYFTFQEFEKRYQNNYTHNDVFEAFENTIEKLTNDGRAGTADNYSCASNSLLSFIKKQPLTQNKGLNKAEIAAKKEATKKKPSLHFAAVTVDFLKDYEKWMLSNGRSLSTVGIYLRPLRALFNEAIADGIIPSDLKPFDKKKYQIPASQNIKKALPILDIEKLFNYETKTKGQARNRDYWVFSYLCYGINIKDMARLQYRQVSKESIIFIRAKTERTTRQNLKPIVIPLTIEIIQIIERWGNKPVTPEKYVFPILKDGLTPKQELAKVRQITKSININIKKIATAVGIAKDISFYYARHSSSTILRNAGAPTALISELLGHSDERTTKNYLASFEDDVKRKYSTFLTDFENS